MRKNRYVSTVLAVLAATFLVPGQAGAQTPVAADCFADDFLPIVGDDQVFDLTVSLYGHPTTSERAQYETVLQHFARGVFEMSNGQHKIRSITIRQDGYQKRFSNIIWARGGGTTAPTAVSHMGGLLDPLGKIYFFDIQQDANGANVPLTDLVRGNADQQRLSGYMLAHEFGHYAYSLGDEYRRFESSTYAHIVSVMSVVQNTVKIGQSDNLQWLNFSTLSSLNWSKENASTTQGSIWGAPSWSMLTKTCQNRPRNKKATGVLIAEDGTQNYVSHFPKSVYYSRLGSAVPSSTDSWLNPNDNVTYPTLKTDLASNPNATDPLEHFNVTWLDSSNVEMEMILDVSGSMSGQPIQNVINAAKAFASQVPLGRTTLGVTTFESVVNTGLVPLRPIAQASDVTAVQNQISTIAVGDNTALFLGAKQGLQKLEDYRTSHGTNASRVVFLLSDGNDNASGGVNETQVTSSYKNAKVRMHTLGFADRDMSENFFGPLERMATATGGIFHRSITQVADLNEAMRIALGDALSVQDIKLGLGDPFPIDTFYSQLDFDIDYSLNPGGGVTFDVLDAFGAPVAHQVFVSPRPDGTFTATLIVNEDALTAGGIGDWQLIPRFTGAGGTITSKRLHAIPGSQAPVELIVAPSHPQTYQYPEPIEVYARTLNDGDITGLAMSAELIAPSGAVRQIHLVDDGTGNDTAAADGLYSAKIADYTENGAYTLKVGAVNDGSAVAIQPAEEPGFAGVPIAPRYLPLSTKFSREAQATLSVSGVRADDHGNDPAAATVIFPDYAPHFGKIEVPGDVDAFKVVNVNPVLGLNVRVFDTSFGMVPKITAYASDGQTVIASGNPFVAATNDGYLSLSIPQASLGTQIFFIVEDLNGKSGGTYTLDVGPPVSSDALAPSMLKVESRDTRVNEANVSGIETRIMNRGGHAISNFKVVYYFETEFFQTPVLEDWWSGASTPRLVQRGVEQYAVEFDYSGFTLEAGASLPFDTENSVGLHYADWSPWNRSNDTSNNGSTTFAENSKLAVFDSEGRLVFGQTPPVHAPRTPVVDVRTQSREDKLSDSKWTSPDVFVENRGDDLSNFVVYYYFNTENGKVPLLADWDSATSNVTLEHISGARYRIKYDYSGFTLPHTTPTPFPSRTLVGVHYPDWTAVNLVNDPSNNRSATYRTNERIQIFDTQGKRIWGVAAP